MRFLHVVSSWEGNGEIFLSGAVLLGSSFENQRKPIKADPQSFSPQARAVAFLMSLLVPSSKAGLARWCNAHAVA